VAKLRKLLTTNIDIHNLLGHHANCLRTRFRMEVYSLCPKSHDPHQLSCCKTQLHRRAFIQRCFSFSVL